MNDLKISIHKYQKTDKTLWNEYVFNHPDTTFQLSHWFQISRLSKIE